MAIGKGAPTFFATAAEWRDWLEKNHQGEAELLVGFYKRGSGKPSITWPESVDAALCFGWIDGVRRRIDDVSYSIRFTPRKLRSIWSAVNIGRVEELTVLGLMHRAGMAAFAAKEESRSRVYSFEQSDVKFERDQEEQFRANKKAWKFFSAMPPSYRQVATWRVISAKRPETREKRLANLISESEAGRTIKELTRTKKS